MTNPHDPWSEDPNRSDSEQTDPSITDHPGDGGPPGPQYWEEPGQPWAGPGPTPPESGWQQPQSSWQQPQPSWQQPQPRPPQAPPPGWYPPGAPGTAAYAYRPAVAGPGLGIWAFLLVVTMTLATIVLGHLVGHDLGLIMLEVGSTSVDTTQLSTTDPALTQRLGTWMLLGLVASLVGIGGWIAAIVAVNRRSARKLSITAIVVGVLAPVLAIFMMISALAPLVGQIPQ